MRQLDLFGSLFEAPSDEQKPEEKQVTLKKEESTKAVGASYSKNGLRSERKVAADLAQTNGIDSVGRPDTEIATLDLPSTPVATPSLSLFDKPVQEIETEGSKIDTNITSPVPEQVPLTNDQPEAILGAGAFKNDIIVETQAFDVEEKIKSLTQIVVSEAAAPAAKTDVLPAQKNPKQPELQRTGSVVFDDGKITVKIKSTSPFPAPAVKQKKEKIKKPLQKRGRKSFKEIDAEVDLIEIPEDDVLFQKQYYPISEVAKWFRVNTSLLRYWENEFDVLKPRKNRKGDRLFRPEDVKNLQLIYQLLRQRKYTIEGAKEYIKTNKKKADIQLYLNNTLQKFKSFLLDLKINLNP